MRPTDIMIETALRAVTCAPLLALAVAVGMIAHAWRTRGRVHFWYLLIRSLAYGVALLVLCFFAMFFWLMHYYEPSTGYDAGNAPVAWIFFGVPLSVGLGQLLALAEWWLCRIRKEPNAVSESE